MAKIYYNKLLMGRVTFEEIPDRYKDAVKEYGKADYEAGRLSADDYFDLFGEEP